MAITVVKVGNTKLGRCICEDNYVVTSSEPITKEILDTLRADRKLGYGQGFRFEIRPPSLSLTGLYVATVADYIDSSD